MWLTTEIRATRLHCFGFLTQNADTVGSILPLEVEGRGTMTAEFEVRPGFPIAFRRAAERVRVTFAGETIAESDDAMLMEEGSMPLVHYFPRADVRMQHLDSTDHSSR
ncbi:MAG: hypothetical protein CMQ61_03320 [Gammaproteobacteria bacterium]|nr:hypothetical protein [Gammaproteobacteria bacterium]|tara:strand:- start:624 stop:947 length:324 start_codon:yes stop_codon:yes gene_type:complete